ncbi:MAG: ankyrin repeat domain-containing protein [Desulfobacter sp.]|nr:MAG: ankyrin repeat domain-containing protein [Desulfobacter sp.]
MSALHFFWGKGDEAKILELLVSCGINLDAVDDDGKTGLMSLIETHSPHNDKAPLIKRLIDSGASLDMIAKNGKSAMDCAYGKPEILELLLGKKDNPDQLNSSGRTGLMEAALEGNLDMCKVFIDQGADINAVDSQGRTALIQVAKGDYFKELKPLLLAGGMDISVLEKKDAHRLKVITQLIEMGADVNIRARDKKTALDSVEGKNQEIKLKIIEILRSETKPDQNTNIPSTGMKQDPGDKTDMEAEPGDCCGHCGISIPGAYKTGVAVISGSPWGYCESCAKLFCPQCSSTKTTFIGESLCCPDCKKALVNPTMVF